MAIEASVGLQATERVHHVVILRLCCRICPKGGRRLMSAKHEKFLKFGLAEGCHLLYKKSSQLLYISYNRAIF